MRDDKRAMLAMPGYGLMAPCAASGFWRCTRTPENLYRTYREGSLLAATFNMLWCDALNHKFVDGHQLDYFAMQHSDVGPEDFWLDTLIEEMEARNLDVLGVVVPIKDLRGMTSIALDRPDGDPWRPLCRLTMAEVFRLPETFTAEDIGHPLLLNTGLWVCKFDESWVRNNICFTVNDQIIYDKRLKRFIPKCEPEDWNFSRQLNRLELRIGATRKVRLVHRGPWEVGNNEPWGTDAFDTEWSDRSVVPDDGFNFPDEVEGWLTYREGRALADLARGQRVLEIGSYCGRSTICLAQTAQHIDCIDPFDGRETKGNDRPCQDIFVDNIENYGLEDKVSVCVGTTAEVQASGVLAAQKFDLVFIDGAHDYENVTTDIAFAMSVLTDDGLIVFHDYHSPADPDVTAAIDEILSAGAELVSTHDSLAVLKLPAAIPLEV